jgi:hypothetical protein
MKLIETGVLVVGAGPAGLTAFALLARAGVNAIGITKYGGTADSPRAHITNQRTVEVLRDLGVEGLLREAAMPQSIMGTQIFATSFAMQELSRTMAWGAGIDRRPCAVWNRFPDGTGSGHYQLRPRVGEAFRRRVLAAGRLSTQRRSVARWHRMSFDHAVEPLSRTPGRSRLGLSGIPANPRRVAGTSTCL